MKFLRNTVAIVALFSTYSMFAARATTKPAQAKPTTKGKAPAKQQVTQQQSIVQPDEYEQILTTLKTTRPFSKNYETLKEIRTEVERQIKEIESTFARKFTPEEWQKMKAAAEQAMVQEPTQNPPLYAPVIQPAIQSTEMKSYADSLVLSSQQALIKDFFTYPNVVSGNTIRDIVNSFVKKYPNFEIENASELIYNAIINNKEISEYLNLNQNNSNKKKSIASTILQWCTSAKYSQ